MSAARFEITGSVVKAATTDGVIYGNAVVVSVEGDDYFDLQGDSVDMDSLISVAVDFMKSSRTGKVQHAGAQVGEIVQSWASDTDIAKAFGDTSPTLGWRIGFQPATAEVATMFANGTLTGFSIGGFGERVEIVDGVESTAKSVSLGKRAVSKATGKRYRLKLTKIDEISGVDRPAQEHAKVALIKSADGTAAAPVGLRVLLAKADKIAKAVWLTSVTDGHQHTIDTTDWNDCERANGYTSSDRSAGRDVDHSHVWVRAKGGKLVIGMADGHTHEQGTEGVLPPEPVPEPPASTDPTIATLPAFKSAPPTPDPEPKMTTDADRIAALTAEVAKFRTIAELPDDQRALYKRLDLGSREVFIAKSATDRAAMAAADVVVFKSADGTEYRASDDPRLVTLAKGREVDIAELALARGAAESVRFAKRAGEIMSNLPGTEASHAAIIGAVHKSFAAPVGADAAVVAVAKAAIEEFESILKVANDALATLAKRAGAVPKTVAKDGTPIAAGGESAKERFDAAVTKHAVDKGIPIAKALVDLTGPNGPKEIQDLYDEVQTERAQAAG